MSAVVAAVAVFCVGVGGFFGGVFVDVASIVAAVAFLVWAYGARRNAEVLCKDAVFKVGKRMFIGWWFVPAASAVMPLKAMREVIEASKAAATKTPYWKTSSPWWVGVWWLLWLGSAVVDTVAADSKDAVVIAVRGSIDVSAAIACVAVIAAVETWQRRAGRA